MTELTDEYIMKKLILNQDIEYYHEYMQNLKTKFNESEPKDQSDMMEIYNAIEGVWCSLINLKTIIGDNE